MLRESLLTLFVAFLCVYAWRDWYKALCGLILLMAVVEHPDMPRFMFGIQGLNPWNITLVFIMMSWYFHRQREGLRWDMPGRINLLLFLYLLVVIYGFIRMLPDHSAMEEWARMSADAQDTPDPGPLSTLGLWSQYLIDPIKWVIPGLLLYDGCRDRERFVWALFAILGIYVLLALQVIRWMPLGQLSGGEELTQRSLRILDRQIGYHRVNLSAMLAGASWAVFSTREMVSRRSWGLLILAAGIAIVFGQALTGGRAGYGAWAVVGGILAMVRWRRVLFLIPAVVLLVVWLVPAASQRMEQGFTPDTVEKSVAAQKPIQLDEGEPDLYTITAGRNIAWPFVIQKIKEAPLLGYGVEAMQRTGTTAMLWTEMHDTFPHPHNAYLQALLDNGVIGSLPIFLFFYLVVKYSFRLFRDSQSSTCVAIGGVALALVLAQLVAAIGSQSFYPKEGTFGMWCAIGLMLRLYVERFRQPVPSVAVAQDGGTDRARGLLYG